MTTRLTLVAFVGILALSLGTWACTGSLPVCITDADCPAPSLCKSGRCQVICTQDEDCTTGEVCQNLQCLAPKEIQPAPLSCKVAKVTPTVSGKVELQLDCNDKKTTVSFHAKATREEPCSSPCKGREKCHEGQCWAKGTFHNPAESCAEILQEHPERKQKDGVYWIVEKERSDAPFKVFCDMTTDEGGWTLCLNARYTKNARHLFSSTYKKIYPPENDPFGYYDFCPSSKSEYRLSLARFLGSSFQHDISDFKLFAAEPKQLLYGKSQMIGVDSDQSMWITAPKDPAIGEAPRYIVFWNYVDPAQATLSVDGIWRGHAQTNELPTRDIYETAWFGAGCYNLGGCLLLKRRYTEGLYDGSNSLAIPASYMHINSSERKLKLLMHADRTQVLYR